MQPSSPHFLRILLRNRKAKQLILTPAANNILGIMSTSLCNQHEQDTEAKLGTPKQAANSQMKGTQSAGMDVLQSVQSYLQSKDKNIMPFKLFPLPIEWNTTLAILLHKDGNTCSSLLLEWFKALF